ncbi:MAG: DUF2703 domain-containing protein [Chloroflexota bacterium]
MDIHFLYFEDCPSHDVALARLREVMAEEGIAAEIRITKVETEEEAENRGFVGSPTILVNGKDIVPPPPDTPAMLTCRVYHWADGRFSPLPSPDMIRNALAQKTTE